MNRYLFILSVHVYGPEGCFFSRAHIVLWYFFLFMGAMALMLLAIVRRG